MNEEINKAPYGQNSRWATMSPAHGLVRCAGKEPYAAVVSGRIMVSGRNRKPNGEVPGSPNP